MAPEPPPTTHASAPVDPVHCHPQGELTVGGSDWACLRNLAGEKRTGLRRRAVGHTAGITPRRLGGGTTAVP